MRRALALAARGLGETSPNPAVGCVVARGARVVGEGFHARAGGPHAEVVALRQAGSRARGATLYVTLEPCAHQGRTPPCAPLVRESGVARVVAAIRDPNPRVDGRGLALLRRAGIAVETGLLAGEAARLDERFLAWARLGRPFVLLKAAPHAGREDRHRVGSLEVDHEPRPAPAGPVAAAAARRRSRRRRHRAGRRSPPAAVAPHAAPLPARRARLAAAARPPRPARPHRRAADARPRALVRARPGAPAGAGGGRGPGRRGGGGGRSRVAARRRRSARRRAGSRA